MTPSRETQDSKAPEVLAIRDGNDSDRNLADGVGYAARETAVTPEQLREARRLLGWSAERLGAMSGTGPHVIRAFEHTGRIISPPLRTSPVDRLANIRAVLEAEGVEFTAKGVLLRGVGE